MSSKRAVKHLTFICTGNICRSLFAEKAFEKLIRETGLKHLKIDSAGTVSVAVKFACGGSLKSVFDEFGVDCSGHKPRRADKKLVKRADILLAMTRYQKAELEYRFPDFRDKFHLLSEYASGVTEEIDDPLGMGIDEYRSAFAKISSHLDNLLSKLTAD